MDVIRRYFNTIKYLKLKQVLYQIRKRLLGRKHIILSRSQWGRRRNKIYKPTKFCCKNNPISSGYKFNFLSLENEIPVDLIGWSSSKLPALWIYNLHYFDCLASNGADEKIYFHKELICRWIRENHNVNGVGWDPYPTSLRIVNWIKWLVVNPNIQDERIESSLSNQIQYLYKNIEYHLFGNHIFSNAKALIFGAIFIEGPESVNWMKKGSDILSRELTEQIKSDGIHFELSLMYHSIILEDILDIINMARAARILLADELFNMLYISSEKMTRALIEIIHPDKEIPYFNDAVMGVATTPSKLVEYSEAILNRKFNQNINVEYIKLFDQSKYVICKMKNLHAILDTGEIGATYIPGHAHADTLSFELSLGRERFIVNSGSSTYEKNLRREYERSTKSHSTVCINGLNSSDVWGGFRSGRRAYPKDRKIYANGTYHVECAHDGYRFLKPGLLHKRCWDFFGNNLRVIDTLSEKCDSAVANYFIGPNFKYIRSDKKSCIFESDHTKVQIEVVKGVLTIQDADYAISFGSIIPIKKIAIDFDESSVEILFRWNAIK